MLLTQQQKNFFETFGYIVLPGLMADKIDWIIDEFTSVFTDRGVVHDGTKRSCIVPFIDQREGFATLIDDPRIEGAIASLIGADFNYLGGDGNYYTGETVWHSDGFHGVGRYLKMAFYLDPVTRDTGALRVIPGSHKVQTDIVHWEARQAIRSEELWGIPQKQVPSVALESNPGDVVIFDHNLMHAAFGGSGWRRMFTINVCQHAETEAEVKEMRDYINSNARFWVDNLHSEIMRSTASPQRMVHLQQVWDNEDELAALSAKARVEMAEPSRH